MSCALHLILSHESQDLLCFLYPFPPLYQLFPSSLTASCISRHLPAALFRSATVMREDLLSFSDRKIID